MTINHSVVKAPGQQLNAVADWNANHDVDPDTITAPMTDFHDDGTVLGDISYWNGSRWVSIPSPDIIYDPATNRFGFGVAIPLATIDVVGDVRFGDSTTNYWYIDITGWQTYVGTARPYTFEPYITDHDMTTLEVPENSLGLHVVFANHATGWMQPNGIDGEWLYMKWFVSDDCDITEDILFCLEYSLDLVAFGFVPHFDWEWSMTQECEDVSTPAVGSAGITQDTMNNVSDWHHETMGITRPPLFTIPGGTLMRGSIVHIRFRRVVGGGDDYANPIYIMALRPMKREISQGLQTPA